MNISKWHEHSRLKEHKHTQSTHTHIKVSDNKLKHKNHAAATNQNEFIFLLSETKGGHNSCANKQNIDREKEREWKKERTHTHHKDSKINRINMDTYVYRVVDVFWYFERSEKKTRECQLSHCCLHIMDGGRRWGWGSIIETTTRKSMNCDRTGPCSSITKAKSKHCTTN